MSGIVDFLREQAGTFVDDIGRPFANPSKFVEALRAGRDWMTEPSELTGAPNWTAFTPITGEADSAMFADQSMKNAWNKGADGDYTGAALELPNVGLGLMGAIPMMGATTAPLRNFARKATTKSSRIVNKTNANSGYTVNMKTGNVPEDGLMMGKYANDNPKNTVIDTKLKAKDIDAHIDKNYKALDNEGNYLGTWREDETGKTYLDTSTRFEPDEIRKATKFGERTDQIAGFNLGKMEEFPVGNWEEFVKSSEMRSRMREMNEEGMDYLSQHPTGEWWDTHGTAYERIYGKDALASNAGFIAATAPNTNPTQNVRMASEYMRRKIKGEPIIQPEYRIPHDAVARTPGVRLGMEAGRIDNLNKANAGNIQDLQSNKVREEAAALMGDQDAVVLDRWWARGAENPQKGVFTDSQEGKFPSNTANNSPYENLKSVISDAAREAGISPRDFSANVWTGMRETVKNTGELFGTKFNAGAVQGESKAYADILTDLIAQKSKHLGITVKEMEKRLASGDAELLTLLIATPLGYELFRASQEGREPNPDVI